MKFRLTIEVEAKEIFGVKEEIAARLEDIGKIHVVEVNEDRQQTFGAKKGW